MEMKYLYWIEFKYLAPFDDRPNFIHGFYSTSANPRYVMATARRYHKKHRIPCEIVHVSEPKIELLIKTK